MTIYSRLLRADEFGIRLEIVNRPAIWEAQPLCRHQKHVERIAQDIRCVDLSAGCASVYALDVYVQFPNP